MNRQQRRAKAKATPAYRRGMTYDEKVKALYKNGITADDLEEEFARGYKAGFREAGSPVIKMAYAAACLILKEQCGFGQKRIERFLKALDDKILYTLTTDEIIDEVFEKTGLKINFTEAFDRVEKA